MIDYPIAPMLMSKTDSPFDNCDYYYEFKFDGVRCLGYNLNNGTFLYNRHLKPRTHLYPEIISALSKLSKGIIIDGEIIAFDNGKQSFYKVLERDLLNHYNPNINIPVNFIVFDILYYEGKSVMGAQFTERHKILESIKFPPPINLSTAYPGIGTSLFNIAESSGLEGIVAKSGKSIYIPGTRSTDWYKIKCIRNMDVVVGGFTVKQRPSLSVGVPDKGKLKYIGNVGNGINMKEWSEVMKILNMYISSDNPFTENTESENYVLPRLTLNVKYLELDAGGKLRQPVINKIYY